MLFLARSSTHLHSKIQRNQGESGVEVDGGPDTEGHGRSLKMDKDLESLKVTTGGSGRDRGPSWLRWARPLVERTSILLSAALAKMGSDLGAVQVAGALRAALVVLDAVLVVAIETF